MRGFGHPTRVRVADAGGARLVLDFKVEPRVEIRGSRSGPGRYTVRGELHPRVATKVVLQRRSDGDWTKVESDKSSKRGLVSFTGKRPGTYRLRVPAADDRVAAHSDRLELGPNGN